ncbi:hypothetical protein Ami103574_10880 [Aminipila butyrica]|uniref:Uncharacterized protein n=1 Tax=Aminipila butyrica TaxID=433296 RepID=A0A858BV19_9FIRM|nr:hypothetical protein [Aminipila butyrica]QIB69793.1 hypothetical protein Ami103574_10880 [Aminipila butyrica]
MKDVIVCCVIMPLTIAIIFLIGAIQTNADQRSFTEEVVYIAAQRASQDGYFTADNLKNMRQSIANGLNVSEDDITILCNESVRYRPEVINYKVEVLLKDVLPANKLFGISNENNQGEIMVENKIMSERLVP